MKKNSKRKNMKLIQIIRTYPVIEKTIIKKKNYLIIDIVCTQYLLVILMYINNIIFVLINLY